MQRRKWGCCKFQLSSSSDQRSGGIELKLYCTLQHQFNYKFNFKLKFNLQYCFKFGFKRQFQRSFKFNFEF